MLTSSRLPTAANENDIVERCPQNVLAPAMTLRIHQESRKLCTNASIKSPGRPSLVVYIKRSSRGESHVMCTYCNEHISIGHGGKNDVKRHVERPKHVENARLARDSGVQARLTDLRWLASSSHSFQDLVTKAEVLFAQFIAEHKEHYAEQQ